MSKKILSSMAGTVWKVLKKPGDSFDFGDEMVILESMKMEIPIEAEDSGTITEILVAEGTVVDEGTALMIFE